MTHRRLTSAAWDGATLDVVARRERKPGEVFVVVRGDDGKLRRWPRGGPGGRHATYEDGLRAVLESFAADAYWIVARALFHDDVRTESTARALYAHLAAAVALLGGREPVRVPTTKADSARALRAAVRQILGFRNADASTKAAWIVAVLRLPAPEFSQLPRDVWASDYNRSHVEATVGRFIRDEIDLSSRHRPSASDAERVVDRALKAMGVSRNVRRELFGADARKRRKR
ncbi:MAG: hypothetical protein HYV09_40525 [Deltaproteobacteria bacterium]|nr:hypothetical protein [Deltaproteobacteria bacterium]